MVFYRNKLQLFTALYNETGKVDFTKTMGRVHPYAFNIKDGTPFLGTRIKEFIELLNEHLGTDFDEDRCQRVGKRGYYMYTKQDKTSEPVIDKVELIEDQPLISLEPSEPEDVSDKEFNLEFALTLTKKDKELELYAREFGYELDARKSLANQKIELEKLVKSSF